MAFRGLVSGGLSRDRRRAIVIFTYLWTFVLLGLLLEDTSLAAVLGESLWWLYGIMLLLGILVILPANIALRNSIQNLDDKEVSELDERQRSVWHRANYRSYKILRLALLVALAYLVLAVEFFPGHLWIPAGDEMGTLFWFAVGLLYLIPTTVAAWTESDPAEEIEENRYEFQREA